ncbi:MULTISPECIES: late competence protein ComER [unclassified Paenibacillus]|uniref:late competence protein ComER n=1 Tax=unclassified Paenibacillus TaxID=185978 RepID=UPI0027850CF9|nr:MULTISPECIES: late competence protein ComER [unclassified Paenibacillus]MDQ0900283.1 competence protein ComER [Paenibacillus sp. V4I7]MDQ0921205.1 competence protein ComER [Paenibacillus sp. V4I5]
MKAGFIGTGSMGSILIEAFIHSGAFNPEQIIAGNRTIRKVELLAETYPGLHVAGSNREVVLGSDLIFLCVKPSEFKKVIDEIKEDVLPSQLIVSITSPVLLKHLEGLLSAKISKIIPSITNYVLSGATLCIHGNRMQPEDKEWLENLFAHISSPIRVSENYTRISSDISSCGPAFLAKFLQSFIDAAVEATGISIEEATLLASEMTLGTGKLLTTGGFNPASLQKRVSVPGGITAEGLRILDNELAGIFSRVICATHAKYEEDIEKAELLFTLKQ